MKITILFASCLLLTSGLVQAAQKAEELIKYRQSAMMFMRWNIATIKTQLFVHPQTYDSQQVIASANAIAAVAGTNISALFAPGTETGKGWKSTRAKATLFERPDEVKKHLAAVKKHAIELARVADNTNLERIKPQFDRLFDVCKGCHKDFRSKN